MNRSDLIAKLAGKPSNNLTTEDADTSVKLILDAIGNSLANGGRVEIRGFGSFSLAYRQPRIGRNPRTGEKVPVGAKYVPYFKAGREMKKRVDAGQD